MWKIRQPELLDIPGTCSRPDDPAAAAVNEGATEILALGQTCADISALEGGTFSYNPNSGVKEFFLGNSVKPRLSVGIGVNWVSPFGPLRIDIAKALLTQEGDETKLFSFNVGTQF